MLLLAAKRQQSLGIGLLMRTSFSPRIFAAGLSKASGLKQFENAADKFYQSHKAGRGLGDSLRTGMTSYRNEKKEDRFREQVTKLLETEHFSWDYIKKLHQDALKDVEEQGRSHRLTLLYDRYIRRGQSTEHMQELEKQSKLYISIIDEFTVCLPSSGHKLLSPP